MKAFVVDEVNEQQQQLKQKKTVLFGAQSFPSILKYKFNEKENQRQQVICVVECTL